MYNPILGGSITTTQPLQKPLWYRMRYPWYSDEQLRESRAFSYAEKMRLEEELYQRERERRALEQRKSWLGTLMETFKPYFDQLSQSTYGTSDIEDWKSKIKEAAETEREAGLSKLNVGLASRGARGGVAEAAKAKYEAAQSAATTGKLISAEQYGLQSALQSRQQLANLLAQIMSSLGGY